MLIVNADNSVSAPYTLTVSGGVAKNQNGEIVTSAKEGDYITLVPAMPEHMNFIKWNYSEDGLWENGNVIKMPKGDLIVTAEYTEALYSASSPPRL